MGASAGGVAETPAARTRAESSMAASCSRTCALNGRGRSLVSHEPQPGDAAVLAGLRAAEAFAKVEGLGAEVGRLALQAQPAAGGGQHVIEQRLADAATALLHIQRMQEGLRAIEGGDAHDPTR